MVPGGLLSFCWMGALAAPPCRGQSSALDVPVQETEVAQGGCQHGYAHAPTLMCVYTLLTQPEETVRADVGPAPPL